MNLKALKNYALIIVKYLPLTNQPFDSECSPDDFFSANNFFYVKKRKFLLPMSEWLVKILS